MKKDNKKALYESIMTSVAKEVKKALNEVSKPKTKRLKLNGKIDIDLAYELFYIFRVSNNGRLIRGDFQNVDLDFLNYFNKEYSSWDTNEVAGAIACIVNTATKDLNTYVNNYEQICKYLDMDDEDEYDDEYDALNSEYDWCKYAMYDAAEEWDVRDYTKEELQEWLDTVQKLKDIIDNNPFLWAVANMMLNNYKNGGEEDGHYYGENYGTLSDSGYVRDMDPGMYYFKN